MSFAHYAILTAIQRGWASLNSDLAAWRKRFGVMVPEAVVDAWHAQLADLISPGGDVERSNIGLSETHENKAPPLILIEEGEESEETEPIGLSEGVIGTLVEWESERVTVHCIGQSKDIARAMDAASKDAVLSSIPWLIEHCGFDHIKSLGADKVQPSDNLLPTLQGQYMRTRRWQLFSVHQVTDFLSDVDTTARDVSVNHQDYTDDLGNQGQVVHTS